MAYCDPEDVIDRLSGTGLVYVADDDADDVASQAEQSASLDHALAAAGAEIDAALAPHVALPLAASNPWLRQRAVDLAVEHLVERKGSGVPASLAAAAARSRIWLEAVRAGKLRVPGLAYPGDSFARERGALGLPRVANPMRRPAGE